MGKTLLHEGIPLGFGLLFLCDALCFQTLLLSRSLGFLGLVTGRILRLPVPSPDSKMNTDANLLLLPKLVALSGRRGALGLVCVRVCRADWCGLVGRKLRRGLLLVHAVVGTRALGYQLLDGIDVDIGLRPRLDGDVCALVGV
jgi:hypothetical protein